MDKVSKAPKDTGQKQGNGQFKYGTSGNPSGRPKGSRNRATVAVQVMLDGEAEEITRKAIDMAKEGDITAMRLVLERILPPRKDTPLECNIEITTIEDAEDITKLFSILIAEIMAGNIGLSDAKSIASILESHRKSIETTELQKKFEELEALIQSGRQ